MRPHDHTMCMTCAEHIPTEMPRAVECRSSHSLAINKHFQEQEDSSCCVSLWSAYICRDGPSLPKSQMPAAGSRLETIAPSFSARVRQSAILNC